jgi:hypothetical protein
MIKRSNSPATVRDVYLSLKSHTLLHSFLINEQFPFPMTFPLEQHFYFPYIVTLLSISVWFESRVLEGAWYLWS